MACTTPGITDAKGRPQKGANRLYTIVVSESAYLIYRLRNERKFDREDDEPEKSFTITEIERRWHRTINDRLTEDRLKANTFHRTKRAINKDLVLETWNGTLENQDSLPPDWIGWKTGVLVGTTARRPRGRNR